MIPIFGDSAPTVRLVGLRPLSRISGNVTISARASDDIGVTRVEFYLDQVLIRAQDFPPVVRFVVAEAVWDTKAAENGKHHLMVKAMDSAGNVDTDSIALVSSNDRRAVPDTITISPAIRYQTINGWETVSQAGQLSSPSWDLYRDPLFDMAVNDLGLNRVRLEIVSGTENPTDYFAQWRAGVISASEYNAKMYEIVNDDADPKTLNPSGFQWSALDHTVENFVLPMRSRLIARGERLWISVNYVDFGSSIFEHKNNSAEYAEFVLAVYRHLQTKYGIVPDSWEVVLEPDTSTANWSADQVAQAVKASGDRLRSNGFSANFVIGSTTSAQNAPQYIDAVTNIPGAMQYVGEFAYHRYCCATVPVLQAISSRAMSFNKNTAMLEWIGADHNALHEDLKIGRNSSWQQFTLAFPNEPDNGAQYYLINDSVPPDPVITMGSRTKFLRQYFKFIRSGAQRVEARSSDPRFDPLAFINPNGKYVIVIKAGSGGQFTVGRLPADTYGIKYTTASEYNVDLPDRTISGGSVLGSIPDAGVVTVYSR